MSNVSSFSNLITSDPGRSWSSIKKWIGFIRNKKLAFKNSLIKIIDHLGISSKILELRINIFFGVLNLLEKDKPNFPTDL